MTPTTPLLLAAAILSAAAHAQAPQQAVVTVPILTATGKGVQIYTCKQSPTGPQWAFIAPEATLTDASGKSIGTHEAGPTWTSADGSTVKGEVINKTPSPDPSSIPWLMLKASATTGTGILSKVEIIRRTDTHGGNAPATGCDPQHLDATVRIPYTATYSFYTTTPYTPPVANYRPIFDNPTIAVFRAHYGPHENVPIHDHPAVATVFVYLNDSGPVRIDHPEPDGTISSTTRLPTVKGAYRIAPALAERHSVENLSDIPSDFLRVELKQTNLQLPEPYRGKAPQSVTQNLDTTEFTNPTLQIELIICVDSSCPIKPSGSPSLLIAFTPLHLAIGDTSEQLDNGSVHYLPPNQPATITPASTSAAHILRILLPAQ